MGVLGNTIPPSESSKMRSLLIIACPVLSEARKLLWFCLHFIQCNYEKKVYVDFYKHNLFLARCESRN